MNLHNDEINDPIDTIEDTIEETPPKELVAVVQAKGLFELEWQLSEDKPHSRQTMAEQELYALYLKNKGEMLFKLGFRDGAEPLSSSLAYLRLIAAAFVGLLARTPHLEALREHVVVELPEGDDFLLQAPFLRGSEHLDRDWLEQVWALLHNAYRDTLHQYGGSVVRLFAELNPGIHLAGRVFFHLVESKPDDEYPFSFLATYSASVSPEGKSRHLPLKNALVEYGEESNKLFELLSTVNKASESSTFVAELVESGEIFHPLGLSASEAYTFLKEIPLYEQAGILCRIPKWWKNKSESLKVSVTIGGKEPARLGYSALVDFDASLYLGGEKITADELKQLLSEAEGLVFIKGKWVEVDHAKLTEALEAYEQALKLSGQKELGLVEAMRLQMDARKQLKLSGDTCEVEVTNGEWLTSVVSRLVHPELIDSSPHGDDFHASLRKYQETGLSWLHYMKSLGLGACLADDMGLGKTVQIIALLNAIRSRKPERALLIVPASLIGNWLSEIKKFAPSLRVYVYHPSSQKNNLGPSAEQHPDQPEQPAQPYDLYITTYGMIAKYEQLLTTTWDTLILDEAQAIKNPGTKQTKLVKQLKAASRIAMTGTPIENRLADLWSLFDFLNKGLLGSAKEFSSFAKRLKESQTGYTRLKQVVSPFILRRLKTDKAVIGDLPEKIEMKTYATLTKKQAVLYTKHVKDLQAKIEAAEDGIARKGLVLSSLMKLKQICNHPDQYLGQQMYAEEESGKYARLREICETIYEKRERVLVFTQFKEITESLRAFLQQIFQHKGLVLHGETAVGKRQEIVEQFQGEAYVPFLVLSIKAGGVGLNLTSANHVIHFDRWWNPAVENQATDRAFRIGQKKNVIVHKFITQGTLEEKIDLMIEDKTRLSQEIIPDIQENWITEMDNQQLMNLFKLTR